MKQPLLIHRSKARDIRAGMPELVYLIPELCRQTGLTDEMRSNFQLMKTLAVHTKIGPDARIQRLLHFNRRLTQNKQVVEVRTLSNFHLRLAVSLTFFYFVIIYFTFNFCGSGCKHKLQHFSYSQLL